ncbi:hypothetical protein KIV45_09845 [Janthinobacterium lividum]|nr:hypothetical protein KIV45_09845 [Janthinobacterium lividum]
MLVHIVIPLGERSGQCCRQIPAALLQYYLTRQQKRHDDLALGGKTTPGRPIVEDEQPCPLQAQANIIVV